MSLLKLSLSAAVLSLACVTTSFAAPPADQDACNAMSFSLAEKAAGKSLPEVEAVKVDSLIAKLEVQCGEGKFSEADATAKEVEAALK